MPLILFLAATTYVIAQGLKYLLAWGHHRPIRLLDSGGMPSSHAAVTAAVTMSIGIEAGFDSPLFALSVIFTAVVAHDAYRVRWLLGQYGIRLNRLGSSTKPTDSPLPEWLGHRPVEIVAGLIIGSMIGALAWVV